MFLYFSIKVIKIVFQLNYLYNNTNFSYIVNSYVNYL